MYYQVKPDSELGESLDILWAHISVVNKAATAALTKIGATHASKKWGVLAGGIGLVQFFAHPGKGWSKTQWDGLYRPRRNTSEGKSIQAIFDELPTIGHAQLNEIIGFNPSDYAYEKSIGPNKPVVTIRPPMPKQWKLVEGLHFFQYPRTQKGELPEDMVEITATAFELAIPHSHEKAKG